ncbi:MAG: serine/threonine protein kinase, partial [Deltaproteobacteria bacterium]|nr:serine/threonine protein kinase [Deltaproteobacteria bacterium]
MSVGSGEPERGQPQSLEGIPRPGDVIASKFVVERVLGVGGMGVVLAARHLQLDVPVAIKFLLPDAMRRAGSVARFLREARAAVRIQSEYVVRVIDVGTHDTGAPFVVMEYLSGRDLSQVLQERGRLAVAESVDFVLQACHAVAQAHALGIVHRDLKPANLFVARRPDAAPRVKVLDFGISKSTRFEADNAGLTKTSSFVGSPLYMSPEQLRSPKTVDPRADIWALGVILYQLLSGRCPFEAEGVLELCAKILGETPTPLQVLWPDVPAAMEQVVRRCLEKRADDRFQTVAELADALAPLASPGARPLVGNIARTQAPGGATAGDGQARGFEHTVAAGVLPPVLEGTERTRAGPSEPPGAAAEVAPSPALEEQAPARTAGTARDEAAPGAEVGLLADRHHTPNRARRWWAAGAAVVLAVSLGIGMAARWRQRPPAPPTATAATRATPPVPASQPGQPAS